MARPLLWRLPLVVFVVAGLAGLFRIDSLLRRDVQREAEIQAQQTQALLEGFLRDRSGYLHGLTLQLAALGQVPGRAPRFVEIAREFHAATPEIISLSLVDTAGQTRERDPAPTTPADSMAMTPSVERALARAAAERTGTAALSGTVTLREGASGVMLYDPLFRGRQLVGFVSAALSYRDLFEEALAGELRGRFAYQVRDRDRAVVARSPQYPAHPQRVVTRAVVLPAGGSWQVDIAVPRFEPFLPRLLTWLGGIVLLLGVVAMVLLEEARAERFAAHSLQLELLSRNLLDANVRLEERAQQVAEANRAKSRFLANVSHELRTPLNAIVGYNALALDGMFGTLAPPLQDAHRRVQVAAEHLLALVDDVLDLAKIEVGRMEVDAAPVDVRAVLESVTTVVEPTAFAKNVHVDVIVARDVPRLTTDGRHLRQILLNLVSNAVKFTERGDVTVVARRDAAAPDSRILVTVEDTGVGIALADQERIFDEFEQVRAGSRGDSMQRGTGLGLAIARKLARLLGGEIAVESTLGVGSRFTLTLPIVAPPRPLAESTPPRAQRAIMSTPPLVGADAGAQHGAADDAGNAASGGAHDDVRTVAADAREARREPRAESRAESRAEVRVDARNEVRVDARDALHASEPGVDAPPRRE